jgi:hypothetical protein
MNHFYKKEKEILMGDFASAATIPGIWGKEKQISGDGKTSMSCFSSGDVKTPISRCST